MAIRVRKRCGRVIHPLLSNDPEQNGVSSEPGLFYDVTHFSIWPSESEFDEPEFNEPE